ncbi:hypothetical protein Ddye_020171 [Dipteronia dyeriana]|uniref:Protein FAR1-RELATED SEQUENCE n=1 Tax=Dipteronia dyeriana TaxID=168575 RepID=A0AAD9U020_9ROSI|nr:hypothetical protein Ddye_020171 [Dipteronia dyeriana]
MGEVVESNDQAAGGKQKMQWKLKKVFHETGSPIESHAANVLQPYAFGQLQEELVMAPQQASVLLDKHHTEMEGACNVVWIPCREHIRCRCHQFEFSGILCRHVLRVLSTNNCFQIPDRYLPIRWRSVSSSFEKRIHLLESMASTLVSESVETEKRLGVACEQIAMVLTHIRELPRPTTHVVEDADGIIQSFMDGNPHESFTPGELKEQRPRDGVDIIRKRRHYSEPSCRQFGHDDASGCPIMASDNLKFECR